LYNSSELHLFEIPLPIETDNVQRSMTKDVG